MRWTPIPMPKEVIDRVEQMAHQEHAGTTLLFEDRDHNKIIDPDQEDDDNDSDYDPNNDDDDDDNDDDDNNNPQTNQPNEPYEDPGTLEEDYVQQYNHQENDNENDGDNNEDDDNDNNNDAIETTSYRTRMYLFTQPAMLRSCPKTEMKRKRKKLWTITLMKSQEWNRNHYRQYKSRTNEPNVN